MINLLRNREVRRYLGILALLGAVDAVCAFVLGGIVLGCIVLAAILGVLAVSGCFTMRRYREIAGLSDNLSQIASGDYSIDLRRYSEGELSVLYDQLHKVTRTLSHQAEELRRDKQWLADTMADISHQLKTPLTSVAMFTELLADERLPDEKRREFLCGIELGTERIRWLVLSLLKLSRLDADAVVFERKAIPAALLLDRALEPLSPIMEQKGMILDTELDDVTITGDLPWLAEAVGNLVKNCVEYAPDGGRIAIRCRENPLYTLLEIEDNGPGIPEEDLPHIFERFYRGKNAAPDSVGIGLALSKSIIIRHNGTVEAGNLSGGGAHFMVKFYQTVI